MVKLTDLQLASLLEEIGCAMRVGAPMVETMRRLETRRLGRVARAAETIIAGLDRGESLADAVAAIHSTGGAQAAAAIRACEKSGDGGLIDRIAVQLRRRSDFDSEVRLAWFYPITLLVVGYTVAVLVMAPLIRQLHGIEIEWPNWVVETAGWLELNWWLPPAVVAVLLFALLCWRLLRTRFPRSVRLALFCEALADQMTYDVPDDVAIAAAAEMSGDRTLISIDSPSLSSAEIVRILSECKIGPDDSVGMSSKQSLIARLRYLGGVRLEQTRRRSYFWSRFVPRCSMVAVGGGLTLSYVWWVIAPVYRQVGQW
jgi:hypothetical protein